MREGRALRPCTAARSRVAGRRDLETVAQLSLLLPLLPLLLMLLSLLGGRSRRHGDVAGRMHEMRGERGRGKTG